MNRKLQIRNSTIDFLTFTKDSKEEGIEVRIQNDDVWLTQKAMEELNNINIPTTQGGTTCN